MDAAVLNSSPVGTAAALITAIPPMNLFRLLCSLIIVISTYLSAPAAEVMVYAASSLSDALNEIAPLFAHTSGHTVRFNFGASGSLARQISGGAAADLIFSADGARVDQLEREGLIAEGSRRSLLGNTLVVIIPVNRSSSVRTLGDLSRPEVKRIAIGEPGTVPAGTYTREYLQRKGAWKELAGKCVPLDTARAALAAVEAENADAGFVFKTDALNSKNVKIAIEVADADSPRITYPAAVLRRSRQPQAAKELLDFLAGAEAQALFARHGFLPPAR